MKLELIRRISKLVLPVTISLLLGWMLLPEKPASAIQFGQSVTKQKEYVVIQYQKDFRNLLPDQDRFFARTVDQFYRITSVALVNNSFITPQFLSGYYCNPIYRHVTINAP